MLSFCSFWDTRGGRARTRTPVCLVGAHSQDICPEGGRGPGQVAPPHVPAPALPGDAAWNESKGEKVLSLGGDHRTPALIASLSGEAQSWPSDTSHVASTQNPRDLGSCPALPLPGPWTLASEWALLSLSVQWGH